MSRLNVRFGLCAVVCACLTITVPRGAKANQESANQTLAPRLGNSYASISSFIAAVDKSGNHKSRISDSEGDLDGDGSKDAVVQVEDGFGMDEVIRLYVLRGERAKTGYTLVSASKKTQAGDLKVEASIKRGSLFVYLEAIRGAWGTAQFAFRKSHLQLIGMKLHIAEGGEGDGPALQVVDSDFNLLTGVALFKRDEPNPSRPLRVDADGPACTLSEYDFAFYFCADRWKTTKGVMVDSLMRF